MTYNIAVGGFDHETNTFGVEPFEQATSLHFNCDLRCVRRCIDGRFECLQALID